MALVLAANDVQSMGYASRSRYLVVVHDQLLALVGTELRVGRRQDGRGVPGRVRLVLVVVVRVVPPDAHAWLQEVGRALAGALRGRHVGVQVALGERFLVREPGVEGDARLQGGHGRRAPGVGELQHGHDDSVGQVPEDLDAELARKLPREVLAHLEQRGRRLVGELLAHLVHLLRETPEGALGVGDDQPIESPLVNLARVEPHEVLLYHGLERREVPCESPHRHALVVFLELAKLLLR
mmetsp:Transcript_36900/g.104103  ORF Transcript_36900/g.104103 Transcript_36900/m.104103 type:complete len:239 (+) Transcript_36900:139-855(+)